MASPMLVRSCRRRFTAFLAGIPLLWVSIVFLKSSAVAENFFPNFAKSRKWLIFATLAVLAHVAAFCSTPIRFKRRLSFSWDVTVRTFYETIVLLSLSYLNYLATLAVSTKRPYFPSPPPRPPLRDVFSRQSVAHLTTRLLSTSTDMNLVLSFFTSAGFCICISQILSPVVKTFVPVMILLELALSFVFDETPMKKFPIIIAAIFVICLRNFLEVSDEHNQVKEAAAREAADPENRPSSPHQSEPVWFQVWQWLMSNERVQLRYRALAPISTEGTEMVQLVVRERE